MDFLKKIYSIFKSKDESKDESEKDSKIWDSIYPAAIDYVYWKDSIPENPNFGLFKYAWKRQFEYDFIKCKVSMDLNKSTVIIHTPTGVIQHGGFGDHTETPRLRSKNDYYYKGCGCTWGIDLDDNRYHKIDWRTGKPAKFNEVYDIGIINNFINNHYMEGATKKDIKDMINCGFPIRRDVLRERRFRELFDGKSK